MVRGYERRVVESVIERAERILIVFASGVVPSGRLEI